MEDLKTTRCLLEVTAPTTGTTQGVTVRLAGGVGSLQQSAQPPLVGNVGLYLNIPAVIGPPGTLVTTASAGPRFGDNYVNGDPDAVLTSFTPSATSTQTKRLYFYLLNSDEAWGDWCKVTVSNRDSITYTATLYTTIS